MRTGSFSVLSAYTFVLDRNQLLPVGISPLPSRQLDGLGDALSGGFEQVTGVPVTRLHRIFEGEFAWRCYLSAPVDQEGRRYLVVLAPSRHTFESVRKRLDDEADLARQRVAAR
ncbi:hypothetical protein CH263_25665 [Rhodococcus sp. 06-1059B-a]|nr:hypothetical protein [Rhodococcus sp. 06-1059B-a]OZD57581.1 hypothetical protein CH263_25665 [Rhodococcus sp. 06-1059B-a]